MIHFDHLLAGTPFRGLIVRVPAGWYWYGWDYQHAFDKVAYPAELLEGMPPHLLKFLQGAKEWALPEIQQDIIDVAVYLMGILGVVQSKVASLGRSVTLKPGFATTLKRKPSGTRARRSSFYARMRAERKIKFEFF